MIFVFPLLIKKITHLNLRMLTFLLASVSMFFSWCLHILVRIIIVNMVSSENVSKNDWKCIKPIQEYYSVIFLLISRFHQAWNLIFVDFYCFWMKLSFLWHFFQYFLKILHFIPTNIWFHSLSLSLWNSFWLFRLPEKTKKSRKSCNQIACISKLWPKINSH